MMRPSFRSKQALDAALEAKVTATKSDTTLECKECEEVIVEVEVFILLWIQEKE